MKMATSQSVNGYDHEVDDDAGSGGGQDDVKHLLQPSTPQPRDLALFWLDVIDAFEIRSILSKHCLGPLAVGTDPTARPLHVEPCNNVGYDDDKRKQHPSDQVQLLATGRRK